MATIRIYSEEYDQAYNVIVDVFSAVLDDGSGDVDYYLKITTTMREIDNSSFPEFRIRTLADIAPGASAASTFSELVDGYVDYFVNRSEIIQSSSSSSSSSSFGYSTSSSSSSSSSSSFGYSTSSSSSSESAGI